ncbi:hypothetical protein PIB30_088007, partial [Stylosanthes scabra]|nr:hypothetical protein [Stylosanthes scabra]
ADSSNTVAATILDEQPIPISGIETCLPTTTTTSTTKPNTHHMLTRSKSRIPKPRILIATATLNLAQELPKTVKQALGCPH